MSGIVFCDELPRLPYGGVAVIDGKTCETGSAFLQSIWDQLHFPAAGSCNWDAYLDWLRDLSWLKEKVVSIIILHYDAFLCREPDRKQYFVSDLETTVFPFWERDAESVFGDPAAVKEITVYCVNGDPLQDVPVTTKDAAALMGRNALNGEKTPHSTSMPVLRMHEGRLCLASFVFFFDREQIQTAMVRRPSVWLVGDLADGRILHTFSCREYDFSGAEYQRLYNVSNESLAPVGNAFWDSTCILMDLIRAGYLRSGTLNGGLYRAYMDRICFTTPADFTVFYRDLSNIETEDISMDFEKTPAPEIPAEESPEQTVRPSPEQVPADPAPLEGAVSGEELLAKLTEVQEALADLRQTFDDKIAEDAHKNGLFDNMHRELIRYQNGALDKIVDTIALDIIQLIDTTKGHFRVYEKKEATEENYKKLVRIVKGISEDLEDILYRQNIEAYRTPGHEVDVRRQKIIQTVPTDDQTKDNLVAVRVADGFEKGDKVLRPERIKIFKYEAAKPDSDQQ